MSREPIYVLILNTLKILARADMNDADRSACIVNLKRVAGLVDRNLG